MIDERTIQFLADLHQTGVAVTGPHRTPGGAWCFHTHPSLHCYIHHNCRCEECRKISYEIRKQYTQRRNNRNWKLQTTTP